MTGTAINGRTDNSVLELVRISISGTLITYKQTLELINRLIEIVHRLLQNDLSYNRFRKPISNLNYTLRIVKISAFH